MSREILFRGKRTDNGEWVEGFYAKSGDKSYIIYDNDIAIGYVSMKEVIPETIGEYTGLTDKNGKKIFEGDIVNCVYDGKLRTYVVVWDKDELDFKATNGEEQYRTNFEYLPCCDEIEIIGNIHDNPELLKGGERK